MSEAVPTGAPDDDRRSKVMAEYRTTLLQHKETDAKVRSSERQRPPPAQTLSRASSALAAVPRTRCASPAPCRGAKEGGASSRRKGGRLAPMPRACRV
eukprot:2822989-Prymnesium_polylepis.1